MGPSSISGRTMTVFIAATASRNWSGSAEVTGFDGRPIDRHAVTGAPSRAPAATKPLPGLIGGYWACSGGSSAGESRRAFLAMRGEAFLHVGSAETEEFQAERRFEGRPEHAVPVVQAVLGPANGILRAVRQILGEARCGGEYIIVVDARRHQADALGFFAEQRLAGEQVVLGLGHADQQRPADRGVVACRHAKFGMPIDEFRGPARHRDV